MNLKLALIFRIAGAAAVCLLGAVAYVLWQADQDLRRSMTSAAEFAGRQLDRQLWQISTGFEPPARFPDWQSPPPVDAAGLCTTYIGLDGARGQNVCNGWREGATAPAWFALLHNRLFATAGDITRPIVYRNASKGHIAVSSNPDMAAALAWRDIRSLIGLQLITAAAACLLIYASVSRALQPASSIMNGLARLEGGDLDARLPEFQLVEFRRIGETFNRVAAHLQSSIEERNALTRRLFQVQEEERRSLARDLHDEFGQCLAGICALAASVSETARRDCPPLLREGEAIARASGHMMQMLRETLIRLRPPEIELGLTDSLNGMVAGWNSRLAGKTRFVLDASGDLDGLPGVIGLNVYRIVQECLTNASKHAEAAEVKVALDLREDDGGAVVIVVEDDGAAAEAPRRPGPGVGPHGVGLLGVGERVAALGGALSIERREPNGLRVRAVIPLPVTCRRPPNDRARSHPRASR